MDDIRWRFVCRDKTEPVSTLLWFFCDLIAAKGRCYCLLGDYFVFVFLLGSDLTCTVVADVACSGAFLCVCVGVLLGFSLHFLPTHRILLYACLFAPVLLGYLLVRWVALLLFGVLMCFCGCLVWYLLACLYRYLVGCLDVCWICWEFCGDVVRKFCGDAGERRVSEMITELCLVCEILTVT